MAESAAQAADSKKAANIIILDMQRVSSFTDYFVIASADNLVQLKAMADETQKRLKELKASPKQVEGYDGSGWILMDYGDVVTHYFLEEKREFYSLERLWGDAPSTPFISEDRELDRER